MDPTNDTRNSQATREKPESATALSLRLPIAQFKDARALFLAATAGTIVIYAWINLIRYGFLSVTFSTIFAVLFVHYDYFAAMAMLLTLLAAAFLPMRFRVQRLFQWAGEHVGVIAVLTFLVCSVGTLTAYHNHPLSMDEYAPLFQSKVFAAGRLNGSLPPEMLDWLIPPGFQKIFLLVSKATGDVASAYWPAYALLLTPFTLAGIPWALNPLLSALTVLVLHRIGLMIFGNQQSAGLVVLFTIASPVFVADGISYYSMTAHLLMNAVYMLLLLQPTPKRLFAAGLVGSIALTLHNPYPHLLFAIPWLVSIARSEKGFVRLLQIGAGYLPLSLLLGLGWYWFLGDLTHRGIVGSQTANMSARVASAFTLPDTTILVARLAGFAKVWLWTVPGLVVLACFGAWRWRTNAPLRLLSISAVLTYLGYFLVVPDQGHGWGFRYFHSAWLALPLLGAAALTARHGTSADRAEEPHAPSSGIQAFAAYCVIGSLFVAVGLRVYQINDFISDHLAQLPSAPVSAPKVVIIDPSRSFYGVDLVQNDPFLRDGVINLLSHGTRANEAMMAKFRPEYLRSAADTRGEVWVPLP